MSQLDRDGVKGWLATLPYPCYLVAHGPERSYRTKFRSEHGGGFGSRMVADPADALAVIDGVRYVGFYSEMDLIAVAVVDGELTELQL